MLKKVLLKADEIRQDCRFFRTDSPCTYHKETGQICKGCRYYRKTTGRILIIKKAAMGDVLRTTCILEPLHKKFPDHAIVWFTSEESREVLDGNPYIDEIWTDNFETLQALSYFLFDTVVNLDLSPDSLIAAGTAHAKKFYGFRYEKTGTVSWSGKAAGEWFLMSHNDKIKKTNKKTYQHIISEILELESFGEIVVPLKRESAAKAEKFAEKHRLQGKTVIGVNTGSGSRWSTKRWPEENFLKLFSLLKNGKYSIILFGGKEEKEIMRRLSKKSPVLLINTGWNNTVADFFALLNLCDIVLTSDTLALHAATGLKKQVIALFGPTSASEIEPYGRVTKIITPLECRCCYKRECDKKPSCMETISPETVFSAIISPHPPLSPRGRGLKVRGKNL
jgi:ADP-heptose:LPS heptosyltransferase